MTTDQPMQQLTPADAAALKILAGASFNAAVTLPSGRVLTPQEAQALASAYAPARGETDRRRPELDWVDRMETERDHFVSTYTRPATPGDYASWLAAWLDSVRRATHRYDYDLPDTFVVLTGRPAYVPSLYGANALQVIAPEEVGFRPVDVPRTFHGGCGHSTFFFTVGPALAGGFAPVYADVEKLVAQAGGGRG